MLILREFTVSDGASISAMTGKIFKPSAISCIINST